MTLDGFQQQIGVRFNNTDLLQQALTHRSYINEHSSEGLQDNERLEFLGDAVLDFVTGDMLYRRFPEMPEGNLTRLRAALVRTSALAELARRCQIGQALRMGKGEEQNGGRERLNNLCNAFEALVGALFLDQGLEAVNAFVMPLLEIQLQRILAESLHIDARSELQEWSQAEHNLTPIYQMVDATGPEHAKEFVVEVSIGEQIVGRGTGHSKQAAAQAAAREALRALDARRLLV